MMSNWMRCFAGRALDIDAPISAMALAVSPGGAEPWTAIPTGLSSGNALLLAPDASLRFLPATDFFGAVAPLSLRLWDGTDAGSYTFGPGQDIRQSIGSLGGFSNDANRLLVAAEILPVNDAPFVAASDPLSVVEGAGAQTVIGWASFVPGPGNESTIRSGVSRSLTFPIPTFRVPPTIASDGSLSYTPAAGRHGQFELLGAGAGRRWHRQRRCRHLTPRFSHHGADEHHFCMDSRAAAVPDFETEWIKVHL